VSDKQTELFDRLYRDNQAKVYRLALSLAGNAHDAAYGIACRKCGSTPSRTYVSLHKQDIMKHLAKWK
jgi:hypothetical protein